MFGICVLPPVAYGRELAMEPFLGLNRSLQIGISRVPCGNCFQSIHGRLRNIATGKHAQSVR
jgi:hypothetical protein